MTPMAVEVRKRCGTIKAFAQALGVSASKAGMICQGRYIRGQTPDDVREIASALGATYQEVVHLISISYRQWSGHEPPEGWMSWDTMDTMSWDMQHPDKPLTFAQVQWERTPQISEDSQP